MKINYITDKQKQTVEEMICYDYEVDSQTKDGTVIMVRFKLEKNERSKFAGVMDEIHILHDGQKVYYGD